jgi:hypothetical protein
MKIIWNRVTWYSKLLALAVFLAAPFYGFWLGFMYGSVHQYSADIMSVAGRVPKADTKIVAYSPGDIGPDLPHASGSCFAGSLAAPYRGDAWRCSAGNSLHDPCFETADKTRLLCVSNPTKASSMLALDLEKPLPGENPVSRPDISGKAWFLQLDNHASCGRFTGTLPYSDKGEIAVYGCTDGRLVFGIDASSQPWIAKTGTLDSSGGKFPPPLENIENVPIAVIWE